MRFRILSVLLLAGALAAQDAPPERTASVSGTVIDSKTQKPVSRIKIFLRQNESDVPYGTLTDSQGRFSFHAIPSGTWTLSWSHSGFYGHIADQGQAVRSGVPFKLGSRNIDNIVFELLPNAYISGVVTLADGSPAEGVEVRAEVVGKLEMPSSATTNDTGAFRTGGLNPGTYMIVAYPKPIFGTPVRMAPPSSDRTDTRRVDPIPTYFPNAGSSEESTVVSVEAGEVKSGTDIVLRESPVFAVRGRLLNDLTGKPAPLRTMIMVRRKSTGVLPVVSTVGTASSLSNGEFEIPALPRGDYEFEANISHEKQELYLKDQIQVRDSDLNDVQLALRPYAVINGRLRMESQNAPLPRGRIQINLMGPGESRHTSSANLAKDGTFHFDGLVAGRYALLAWMPEGSPAYVRSAIVAGNAQPLDQIQVPSSATPLELELLIAQDGGRLHAQIPRQTGEPELVNIRLFDAVDGRLLETLWVRKPAPYVVEVASIPPGRYRLLTWYGDQPPCDIFRSGACRDMGQLIDVAPSSEQRIELEIQKQ